MPRGGYRFRAGRHGQRAKVEHCRSIDVRDFSREGVLEPGQWSWSWRDAETKEVRASITARSSPGHVVLAYVLDGHGVAEHVDILSTACALGGARPWFSCPQCHGRVAILHLCGHRFACRRCHGLSYKSQSHSHLGRALAELRKLEARLAPGWGRPKGMHFSTCARLQERVYRAALIAGDLSDARTRAVVGHLEAICK